MVVAKVVDFPLAPAHRPRAGIVSLALSSWLSVSANAQTVRPPETSTTPVPLIAPNLVTPRVPSRAAPDPVPLPTMPTPGLHAAALGRLSLAAGAVTPTAVGRTKGTFSVSPIGAAVYRIPIWAPPGARGIQPNLSLTYNSQTGDGLLGPGWTLSGLSVIARCAATQAQDSNPGAITLTSTDKFCINGNRLRLVSGTYGADASTYQTELADFSNVILHGTSSGPTWFEVKAKDGRTYEYGNSNDGVHTDSRVVIPGSSTAYVWALNKIRDRQGNNLIVTYAQTNGSYEPVQIQYTQTPTSTNGTNYPNSIALTYGNRPTTDNLDSYMAGLKIQQTSQLNSITVSASGTNVREYDLYYTPSATTFRNLLTTIQECGFNPAPTKDCLPPTTISYQGGTTSSTAGIPSPATSAGTAGGFLIADIDGDGHDDLLYSVVSGTSAHWWVKFGTASGPGAAVDTTLVTSTTAIVLLDDFLGEGKNSILAGTPGGSWSTVRWNPSTSTFASTSVTGAVPTTTSCATADVNGDGKPDLVCVHTSDSQPYIRMNTSSSSVSFGAETLIPTAPIQILSVAGNNAFPKSNVRSLDFNGDGHQDLLVRWNEGAVTFWGMLMSTGSNVAPGLQVLTNEGLGQSALPLNFNNDGCTDVATWSAGSGFSVVVSPCNGAAGGTIPFAGALSSLLALDWDGDGRTDLMLDISGTYVVYLSQGDSLSASIPTGISDSIGNLGVLDVDGDGLDDLVAVDTTTQALKYSEHNGLGTPPDLAMTFTDGYGNYASPAYVSIARGNYTKFTDGVFPDLDYAGPMYVVSQFTASAGNSQTYNEAFQYFGAHTNVQGRGFDAFWSQDVYDSRTGMHDSLFFQRTFPYTGMFYFDTLYQPNQSLWVHHDVNQFALSTLDATANNQRYFPYVITRTDDNYESDVTSPVNGTLITEVVTNYVYDSYGNATTVTETTTDKDTASPWYTETWTTKTALAISNDTTNWCLGRPAQQTVTNTVPGTAAVTRTTSATVDYVNCRVEGTVAEPAGALQVTSNYLFDTCGNIKEVDVTGTAADGITAMPMRATKFGYGARCELPETITNALSEPSTTIAYNYTYGRPITKTDANGLKTQLAYDDFGRLTKFTRLDGSAMQLTYNACNAANNYCSVPDLRLAIFWQELGINGSQFHSADLYLDGLDRLRYDDEQNITGGLTYKVILDYDALGNVQYKIGPYFPTGTEIYHEYAFDLLNRVTLDQLYTVGTGLDRQIKYTHSGRQVLTQDANLNVITNYFNVWSQLGERVDPSPGGTTTYTYEAFGNLAGIKDAASPANQTTWSYDKRGHLTGMSDPDRGNWIYQQDSLGELTKQTDAKDQVMTLGYDLLGRLISRSESEGNSAWVWGSSAAAHNYGQLACVNSSSATTCAAPMGYQESYSYDGAARLTSIAFNADTTYQISYAYNTASGLLDNVTYPASTGPSPVRVQYLYTDGILSEVRDFNTPSTIYWQLTAQDAWGHPTNEQLFNGVHILSGTDPATGDLTSRASGTNATLYNNQQNLTYKWDGNQSVTDRIDGNQSSLDEHFSYDALNRLEGSTLAGVSNLSLGFDATGNIASMSGVGSYDYTTAQSACSYTGLSPQPHAVRNAGGSVYCYDKNGNATSARGTSIQWTSYNLPSAITSGTVSSSFAYTPNRRFWKQSAQYTGGPETSIYIGGIFEKVSGATTTDYLHLIPAGSATVVLIRSTGTNNETYYVTSDHLGSSSLITDHTGAIKLNASYGAYGTRRGSNWAGAPSATDWTNISKSTRHGFTEHTMLDNLNLIHMNGRVYDNVIGRFLSADPALDPADTSQASNPYSYVFNNPLTYIDPRGYDGETVTVDSNLLSDGFVAGSFDAGGFSGAGHSPSNAPGQQAKPTPPGYVEIPLDPKHLETVRIESSLILPEEPMISSFIGLDDLAGELQSWILTEAGCKSADCQIAVALLLPLKFKEAGGARRAVSAYVDTRDPGARVANFTTDATGDEAGATLKSNGFTETTSVDGQASIYTNADGDTYVLRPSDTAPGGQALVFYPSNGNAPIKINLGGPPYTP